MISQRKSPDLPRLQITSRHKSWTILLWLGLSMLLSIPSCAETPEWNVGSARIDITPRTPMWMGGFAARTRPSEGTSMPLYVKALVIEDKSGHRVVLLIGEVLGFTAQLANQVAQRVEERFGVTRDELLFSATHTHSGPFIRRGRPGAWQLAPEAQELVYLYAEQLVDYTVEAVGAALNEMSPARLSFGKTETGFGVNRRVVTDEGVQFGVAPEGVVDHSVPVLKIEDVDGRLRAVLFGYACHNTTLGPDNYLYHGDFAGVAHAWLEDRHPGALAFFVTGCGADVNPDPRRGMETVQRHGEDLAEAVEQLMAGSMDPVRSPLRSELVNFPVPLSTPPTHEELEERLHDDSIYIQRHAAEMLKILDREGQLMTDYPYTLQVLQFGDDLTLVALAGEVVVDYSLRLKKELAPANLWVAANCNDVFAYIPSRRVLEEGGYEADSSMMFYGLPGPWDSSIEEVIVAQVHEVVRRLRDGR